jgi:hypothetical protein
VCGKKVTWDEIRQNKSERGVSIGLEQMFGGGRRY